MASLDVQGGRGQGRAVDAQVPLVPFIDLLLCCVMFLLVTAVWNQLGAQDARMSGATPDSLQTSDLQQPTLLVRRDGYALTTGVGDSLGHTGADNSPENALAPLLRIHRSAFPHVTTLAIAAEDGVDYQRVIQAMDEARRAGFASLVMAGA